MTILYWYLGGVVFFTLMCRWFPWHTPEMGIIPAATYNKKYVRAGLYTVIWWPLALILFFFSVADVAIRYPFKHVKVIFNRIIKNDEQK